MNNIVNQVSYLRTSRQFPQAIPQLTVELTNTYIEVANAVNNRIISIFPTNIPAITGENWFIANQRQQTFRQVFTFTTTAPIPHGINLKQIDRFTRNFGQYTDSTNWYGLPNSTTVAIAGQITFYIDPTNIVFLVGALAPPIAKGNIVLEWLTNI
jgi:hypothetical protein